jgi:hypothetical protein
MAEEFGEKICTNSESLKWTLGERFGKNMHNYSEPELTLDTKS